jgi:hypothetical protein
MVYLLMTEYEPVPRDTSQICFVRPRGVKSAHVFRVLIHINAIEDLLFYHPTREELIEDGKIPWWDFGWQYGRIDGELEEDELHPPKPTKVSTF